jgi:hypothetical protein
MSDFPLRTTTSIFASGFAPRWRIIWTPTVELYHHESASVGRPHSSRRRDEFPAAVALMRERWGPMLDRDPCYNPNLSLRKGFNLAFPPRDLTPHSEQRTAAAGVANR